MNQEIISLSIHSLIQSGEDYNAEFKIRVPGKLKELTEEVCAFANAAGGILLIGVGDDNTIHGVSIDNAKRSAIQNALDEMNAAELPMPEFKTEGMFSVILQRPTKSSGKSSGIVSFGNTRSEIIRLIHADPSITREELAGVIGITERGIDYHLIKMKKEGILKRKGSRKLGTWVLNPDAMR